MVAKTNWQSASKIIKTFSLYFLTNFLITMNTVKSKAQVVHISISIYLSTIHLLTKTTTTKFKHLGHTAQTSPKG